MYVVLPCNSPRPAAPFVKSTSLPELLELPSSFSSFHFTSLETSSLLTSLSRQSSILSFFVHSPSLAPPPTLLPSLPPPPPPNPPPPLYTPSPSPLTLTSLCCSVRRTIPSLPSSSLFSFSPAYQTQRALRFLCIINDRVILQQGVTRRKKKKKKEPSRPHLSFSDPRHLKIHFTWDTGARFLKGKRRGSLGLRYIERRPTRIRPQTIFLRLYFRN